MNTMPMATYLAVESVRRQFDPTAEPVYVHDPIRWPRFRPARAVLARGLHIVARVIAPPAERRLSSAAWDG